MNVQIGTMYETKHQITGIVFDGMDLQTHKVCEFECRTHGTSIIVTFCLADNNLIMQLMNGSASNIIQLIKFDANIVAMDELLLN